MGLDLADYLEPDAFADGIKNKSFSSQDVESDMIGPDELGVATVEVVAAGGTDDAPKRVKVRSNVRTERLNRRTRVGSYFRYVYSRSRKNKLPTIRWMWTMRTGKISGSLIWWLRRLTTGACFRRRRRTNRRRPAVRMRGRRVVANIVMVTVTGTRTRTIIGTTRRAIRRK